MTTYEATCPICEETIEREIVEDDDEVAIPLIEFELHDHMVEEHSRWEMLYHGLKQKLFT